MSKPCKRAGGYTVIETMVYLAVTSALFVAVATIISGQQGRTEFTQTVREVESRVRDLVNDIETGYYPSQQNFSCQTTNESGRETPRISTASSDDLGTNSECVFLGQAFHFPINQNPQSLQVYTVVANRLLPNGKDATTFADLNPVSDAVLAQTYTFSDAISFEAVRYGLNDIGAFGVYSSPAPGAGGEVGSGSVTSNLVPLTNTRDNSTQQEVFNDLGNTTAINPSNGIEICLKSNTNDQYGIIRLGAQNRKLVTEAKIGESCTW